LLGDLAKLVEKSHGPDWNPECRERMARVALWLLNSGTAQELRQSKLPNDSDLLQGLPDPLRGGSGRSEQDATMNCPAI
jgi:hypothetical protein